MAELLVAIIEGVGKAFAALLKALFGTSKPREEKVVRPKPEVEVKGEKTDEERLRDLGL